MAEAHSKPLSQRDDVEIVGYCDVDRICRDEKAAKYGGKAFVDPIKMLNAVKPDAVYVLLPPFAHGIELELIARRIPFFIEKPIGLDMKLTRKIAAAVAEKRLLTCAGYMNRYRKPIQTLKKLLEKNPAILVLGGWIGGTPGAPKRGIGSWWIRKNKSGGQFLEQVTHTVDLVRFLCGEATQVQAFAAKDVNRSKPERVTIEDASVVNIKLACGAVANLYAGCCADAGGGGVTLTVYANKATAVFTGWEHSLKLLQRGKPGLLIPGEGDIFAIEDAAFINAVKTHSSAGIMSSYADAAKTLAISVAANESMKTGKPVRL
jgi:predicted dehydrogenase